MRNTMLIGLCLVLAASATGTSIFNTGVNDGGTVLPSGSIDPHYTLASSPNGSGPAAFVVIDGQFPFLPYFPGDPVWLPNGADSKWIGPVADGLTAIGGPPGDYTYETTFTLKPSEFGTFQLTGQMASDNSSRIFLNGVDTGMGASGSIVCCFEHFTTFHITSGFVAGVNRLDIVVNNADCGPSCVNPTGLRVEFGAVPEPTTLMYLAGGILAISLSRDSRLAALMRRLGRTK